jgi:hypothetical protein
MTIYHFADGALDLGFTHPDAISPEEAAAVVTEALTAAGLSVLDPFIPEMQSSKADGDPPEYVTADLCVALPDGRKFWVGLEVATDVALS